MLKQLMIAAALVLAVLGPGVAEDVSFSPNDMGQVEFTMPSGNIGCVYTPEGGTDVYEPQDGGPELICERVEPSYVTVIVGPEGSPQVIEDPGEQSCCGATNSFTYDATLELDGFSCDSATTGLTCRRDDGVGFHMARAGITLIGVDDDDDTSTDEDDEEE